MFFIIFDDNHKINQRSDTNGELTMEKALPMIPILAIEVRREII